MTEAYEHLFADVLFNKICQILPVTVLSENMSMFLMRPVSLTCQRVRQVTDISLKWQKNDFCMPAFDCSGCNTPLAVSYPRLRHHPRAIWKVSNYRRGTDIFGESRGSSRSFEGDYDDESGDEEDRSLDLFIRFVHTLFKKVSRRARKAARSILPPAISPELVGFSVNGVLILTSLWIVKAFLQVVCTLGSVVFVTILLLRGIWSAIAFIKINGNRSLRGANDDNSWSAAQPVT